MPYRAAAPAPVKAWAEIVRRIEGLAAQHSNGTLSEPTSMAVGGTTLLISCAPTQLSTEMKESLLGMKVSHTLHWQGSASNCLMPPHIPTRVL